MSVKCMFTFLLDNGTEVNTGVSTMSSKTVAIQFARDCCSSQSGWCSVGKEEEVDDMTYVFGHLHVIHVKIEWI